MRRTRFKAGDKVRCIVTVDEDGKIHRGDTGIVVVVGPTTLRVKWDNLTSGHNLSGLLTGNEGRSGWNVLHHEVELCEVWCPKCHEKVEPDILGLCPHCTWLLERG